MKNMKITICIGSSCHIKGSRVVVERIQELVESNNLGDKVAVKGAFCMGRCVDGVCVTIDEKQYSVNKDEVDEFFEKEVLANIE
ncbi:MAG: (2Fe-2S) ferredoxin domain-containing protein [Monoglobaceae bacterium]